MNGIIKKYAEEIIAAFDAPDRFVTARKGVKPELHAMLEKLCLEAVEVCLPRDKRLNRRTGTTPHLITMNMAHDYWNEALSATRSNAQREFGV